MDKSVDPCEDFYEHACGKWAEHNPIPEGQDSWSMFKSAQMNVVKQIQGEYRTRRNFRNLCVTILNDILQKFLMRVPRTTIFWG